MVGGGIAGRAAAAEAAARGDRVLLVDEGAVIDDPPTGDDVTVLPNATALGVYDAGYVVIHERTPDLERVWHVGPGTSCSRRAHSSGRSRSRGTTARA